MRLLLYCLAVWVVASVPVGLFLGQVCRLSDLPQEPSGSSTDLVRPVVEGPSTPDMSVSSHRAMREAALAEGPPRVLHVGHFDSVGGLA